MYRNITCSILKYVDVPTSNTEQISADLIFSWIICREKVTAITNKILLS